MNERLIFLRIKVDLSIVIIVLMLGRLVMIIEMNKRLLLYRVDLMLELISQ